MATAVAWAGFRLLWMSANSETGPMPIGGGGSPHGYMCSCGGVPGSGASDPGVCADAAPANVSAPENASERARTTFPISASWQTSPGTFAIISRAAKEAVNWTTWAVVGPSRRRFAGRRCQNAPTRPKG